MGRRFIKTKQYIIKIENMTITEKIIEAIKEKEVEINKQPFIKIFISVQDSEVVNRKLEISWKPKK